MMASEISNQPFVLVAGSDEELLLSRIVTDFGVVPMPETSKFTFAIPKGAHIRVVDDLPSVGFGPVELRFIVQDHAQLFYRLKEVIGVAAVASGEIAMCGPAVLDRSITCVLAGRGANADMRCFYFGDAKRLFKVKTHQEHIASNATSNVVIKAVLTDEARLTCHSMISVAPGANGTNAEQVNKNILLSRGAHAVSIPMLEVLANDVKCKHGAAGSRLNDEEMFYLQSRGISPTQTRTMLLEAFLT